MMKAVRFHTVIGEEPVIRLPIGVELVRGQAEIIVLQHESPTAEVSQEPTKSTWPLVERLARSAEELGITDLPADLAENHDHYAHGAPRGIDKL